MQTRWSLAALAVTLVGLTLYVTNCSGCSKDGDKPPKRTPTPVDPATTGTINGAVLFKGTPPIRAPIQGGGDAVCAQDPPALEEHAIVISTADGRQVVRNAFVWIKGGLDGFVPSVPDAPVIVDQKKCIFVPHVVGVQRYQTLRYTNSDPTEHNVKFTETKGNPEHDKTMTGSGQNLDFWFPSEAVMMRVICNKHSWMRNWVGVVDHPFFAVTGDDGAFELKGVPPGNYTLGCWTEAFGTQEATVKLDPKGTATNDFAFERKD